MPHLLPSVAGSARAGRLLRGRARTRLLSLLGLPLLLGAAGAGPAGAQSLLPPPGNDLLLSTFGDGVQIYRSLFVGGAYQWAFVAPSATLYADPTEATPVATHFAGPTWKLDADGSTVVGMSLVSAPSPNPNSIPQLLLAAKSHGGTGLFDQVSYVQRLNTVGGTAPATAPTALGQEADVHYTAMYNFYAPAVPETSTASLLGLGLVLCLGGAAAARRRRGDQSL